MSLKRGYTVYPKHASCNHNSIVLEYIYSRIIKLKNKGKFQKSVYGIRPRNKTTKPPLDQNYKHFWLWPTSFSLRFLIQRPFHSFGGHFFHSGGDGIYDLCYRCSSSLLFSSRPLPPHGFSLPNISFISFRNDFLYFRPITWCFSLPNPVSVSTMSDFFYQIYY